MADLTDLGTPENKVEEEPSPPLQATDAPGEKKGGEETAALPLPNCIPYPVPNNHASTGTRRLPSLSDIEKCGTATGQVIDFRRYRLARIMRDAGRQQGELARMLRESSDERTQLADALQAAQGHLVRISDGYKMLLSRLQREKGFRTACLEATELDDLDEMVRRRDALVQELEEIRRHNRQSLTPPSSGDSGMA